MVIRAPKLQRSVGLFQSTVLNLIDMVGIGPFVTLPIVMSLMGGMFLYAWIAGAILSLIDTLMVFSSGHFMYFILARMQKQWPFKNYQTFFPYCFAEIS